MPLNDVEQRLREKVRKLMQEGRLPSELPSSMLGGYGNGEYRCDVCQETIGERELEYEYCIASRPYRFHRLCHAVWQLECEKLCMRA